MEAVGFMRQQIGVLDKIDELLNGSISKDKQAQMVSEFGKNWKTDLRDYVDHMRLMCRITIALTESVPEKKAEPNIDDMDFLD